MELQGHSKESLAAADRVLPELQSPKATPEGSYVELTDPRKGLRFHQAYLFSVAHSEGTVRQELKQLLGQEPADRLAKDWGERCNLDLPLKETQVALFLNSNYKARDPQYADRGDTTTQEEDFNFTGYDFASDVAATLLCARVYTKGTNGIQLSKAEEDLHQKLKKEG